MGPQKSLAETWLLNQQVTKLVSAAERGALAPKEVVVIVGPSGVGKSTLISRLMKDFPNKFGFSVSHTTRSARPGEEDGVHYNFTTHDQIRKSITKGAFIEHAEVHGNVYGTSFDAVQRVVSKGQVCLLDIDVQGARQIKNSTLHHTATYIFVRPPSIDTLGQRLRSRGTESEERILLRLHNAGVELKVAEDDPEFFDTILVNEELNRAYSEFRQFMEGQCGLGR